jgi:hypothetical protein
VAVMGGGGSRDPKPRFSAGGAWRPEPYPAQRHTGCGRTIALRGLRIGDGGSTDLTVDGNLAGGGFGDGTLPVKAVPTSVMIHSVWSGGFAGTMVSAGGADQFDESRSDFGHDERWQRLCVVTLSKALLLQLSSSCPGCSMRNPRSVIDRTMAAHGAIHPPGASFLE